MFTGGFHSHCRHCPGARLHLLVAGDAAVAPAESLSADADVFETVYFNNLVLSLELDFVHRTRGLQGKDGNALNEARVISNSIMTNKGRLLPDKTIKLDPEKSVLKYTVGEKIKVKRSTLNDWLPLSSEITQRSTREC